MESPLGYLFPQVSINSPLSKKHSLSLSSGKGTERKQDLAGTFLLFSLSPAIGIKGYAILGHID